MRPQLTIAKVLAALRAMPDDQQIKLTGSSFLFSGPEGAETIEGGLVAAGIRVPSQCDYCWGYGVLNIQGSSIPVKCLKCGGSGEVLR